MTLTFPHLHLIETAIILLSLSVTVGFYITQSGDFRTTTSQENFVVMLCLLLSLSILDGIEYLKLDILCVLRP